MNARTFIDRYNESTTEQHCETLYADWTQLMWSNLNNHRYKETSTAHHINGASAAFFKTAQQCEQLTHMKCHLPDRHSHK